MNQFANLILSIVIAYRSFCLYVSVLTYLSRHKQHNSSMSKASQDPVQLDYLQPTKSQPSSIMSIQPRASQNPVQLNHLQPAKSQSSPTMSSQPQLNYVNLMLSIIITLRSFYLYICVLTCSFRCKQPVIFVG